MHRRILNLQHLICCFFVLLLAGCAADVVSKAPKQQSPFRSPVIAYFEDSSRAMRLQDILQPIVAARFRRFEADRVANFGMSESAIWGRIDVAADESVTLVVELSTTRLDHVTWWEVQGSEIVGEIRNGWYDGKPGAPAPQKYPSISIDIPDGQTATVLFRVTSDCSLTLPLTIADSHNYQETFAARCRYDNFQIGANVTVVCLCLLLAATFRDWNYVCLALCCAAGVNYGLTFDTTLSIPTVQLPPWCSRVGCSFLATAAAFWMLLFFVNLEGWTNFGRRDRVLAMTDIVACAVFLIAQLIIPFRVTNLLLTYFLTISEIVGLWLISNRYRRSRQREELLMILVILTLHAPALLLVFQFQQILPTWIAPQSMRFISTPTVVSGLLCLMLRRYQSTESLKLKVAQAQAGESEARLAVLRFQLNPHRLLNSLTAISTLSRINPERVPALIDCLSGIIHSRLKPPPGAFWKLDEELHLVRSLVAIANVRFGDGLICEESIDPQTADCLIPDLLLQPLVENALKYGRLIDGFPFVSINTRVAQSKLNVKIVNFVSDGEFDASVKSLGIGIANIRGRLEMLYGAEANFSFNYTGNKVIAEISLPVCRQH